MFRARLPSIFITSHKMPRLPRNLHVVTTWRSPDNAICKEHAARHVWSAPAACHAKRPWRSPKNATHLLKTKSTAPATQSDFWHVIKHVWMTKCHACHAKRSYATFGTSTSDSFCRTRDRHGHSDLSRTVANGCERKRDVERTHPQPPDPQSETGTLLRIREKHLASNNHGTRFSWLLTYVQVRMNRPPPWTACQRYFPVAGHLYATGKIKGPDNPTRQLLPILSTKCCSGDGEGRKDKGGGGGSRSKTKLCVCVTKLYVKDGVWQRKMVCVCVTKLCVKDGVCESCVWKRACDKVVCERWCVTKLGVKDGVWKMVCDKDGVWKRGCHRWCGEKWCVWQSGVWRMVWRKMVKKVVCERWSVTVCERWCVTKWCVNDGVSKMVGQSWGSTMVCDKVVCERWCVKDGRWQSGVWKMVCQRCCVTKLGVKDGVWQRWCVWKRVCQRWCVKDGVWKKRCVKDGVW